MFEHRSEPLADRRHYWRRQLRYGGLAFGFVGLSLALGAGGYATLGGLDAADAFLNAAMILAGMGPVDPMPTDGAKLFSACYALYSGIAMPSAVAVLLAPPVHRMMHALHLEEEDRD
ncbi:MAG: hypothetical protein IT228_02665 [Flavobacteriales bacterium]|nr:hypothetical protein [Flavobacteriales bacterium]MCC6576221.1 hypothetical protein [Flavobacteriales bacterium]NUQ14987.1 hypothetical protein [Flavobacteriales bacterium]